MKRNSRILLVGIYTIALPITAFAQDVVTEWNQLATNAIVADIPTLVKKLVEEAKVL